MLNGQKLGPFLQNKWVQKLKLSTNVNTKNCSPNPMFLQKQCFYKNQVNFWHSKMIFLSPFYSSISKTVIISLVTFRKRHANFVYFPNANANSISYVSFNFKFSPNLIQVIVLKFKFSRPFNVNTQVLTWISEFLNAESQSNTSWHLMKVKTGNET